MRVSGPNLFCSTDVCDLRGKALSKEELVPRSQVLLLMMPWFLRELFF